MSATGQPPPKPSSEVAAIADIEQTRDELREEARRRLGVVGDEQTRSFRRVKRDYGLSYYPLVALGLLIMTDGFQSYAFTVLTPEISRAMGVSIFAFAAARSLQGLAFAAAPLPMAWLTQNKPRRALLCIVTGLAWAFITVFTGFVTALIGLVAILFLDGLTTGSITSLHQPLVFDSYPPEARVRAISAYNAAAFIGNVGSPLLVAFFAGAFDLTWRGVFLCLGVTSLVMTLGALGLRDPGFGTWDTERIRAAVREAHDDDASLRAEDVRLGFWEICRRLLLIPTNRRTFVGFAMFGVLQIPLNTFVSYYLDTRWNVGPGGRGLFFAYYSACSVVALLIYGRRGEKQFRAAPGRIMRAASVALAAGVVCIAVGALVPNFGAFIGFLGVASALTALITPVLGIALLSIVPANMRPHGQALAVIFTSAGSVVGSLTLGSVQNQFGAKGTMVAVGIIGVLGAWVIGTAGKFVEPDIDRMVEAVLEDEEIRRLTVEGHRLPMLACRGIDFSYGQLQVLFDVDFTVDDGEMVALLGVNGAGKSTLLKVISGIGLPNRGSVRYRGQEITYLDAERRLRLGITQIPGGRAVFGPMTVVENLRSYGFTLGRDRRAVDAAIDNCLDAFPRLAERRNSLAATLSGGEQQMLGLSKALMLRPRLLLIDELSLGLAPVIVGQLLEMVRRINADGTAVVLVEQSVNIALNLVEHAYFMEKGEMRFDGRADELLARDDLLRAVFLQGVGAV
jgi:ABC-type branched-subunit amino acid transport system ATPase component/sugar phosphate permease